ncbi:DUF4411 family protein [Flavobacterium sp. NKUCC04_CG]|uniref:DUF4411 family protein n=1 Tax=Flavobacterium sp. NKUCC04_CG TaxID=2842121 RepID=UPI001C5B285F|nr:DUF4411 family protein [Flavobacterium sp. NKUCC04_CG]MBW3518430.1 DUF4411 family protein [Flavobacterium sp. NKUCC04_CG]
MIVVIDTSSLLSLVRYYLPFDKKTILFEAIKSKIANGEILVIDKIIEECNYTSKGIVVTTLTFLADKTFNKTNKLPLNTEFLLPPAPAKFLRLVDNQFVIGVQKNRLTEIQYDSVKNDFMNSADVKLILTSLTLQRDNPDKEILLVTEETEFSNDNKVFKKIPAMCSLLGIKTINIQQLIKKLDGINFEIN